MNTKDFSKKYKGEMQEMKQLGYEPVKAKIRFIVAWKGKDDLKESVIVLADIYYQLMVK